MSIAEQEKKLFDTWRTTRAGFVSDGVIDEGAYLNSRLRILFILKEVNDLTGGGWDLREFVREGGRPQTWNNITAWVEGLRNLNQDIPWENYINITEERRRTALQSIAVINLKKSPGSHTTNVAELEQVAQEDQIFLNEQFSFYHPDLIICCGQSVTSNCHKLITRLSNPNWKKTHRGIEYHEYENSKFVLSFSHPEARVANNLLYYGLIDAAREILSPHIL